MGLICLHRLSLGLNIGCKVTCKVLKSKEVVLESYSTVFFCCKSDWSYSNYGTLSFWPLEHGKEQSDQGLHNLTLFPVYLHILFYGEITLYYIDAHFDCSVADDY